jgi:hypothetical protein
MVLGGVFCDRIISSILWPPYFRDLTLYAFFVCSNLKDDVYRKNPSTKEKLKENTQREILKVP